MIRNKDNVIEIEVNAEKLYYTVIGKYLDLKKLINKLKSSSNKKYIISKLLIPISNTVCDEYIIPVNIEYVQCSILCVCNKREEKTMYCLLCVDENNNKKTIKFPEIQLKENSEPEKLILNDMEKTFYNVPDQVKSTLQLVDITGPNSDILVYCSKISNK